MAPTPIFWVFMYILHPFLTEVDFKSNKCDFISHKFGSHYFSHRLIYIYLALGITRSSIYRIVCFPIFYPRIFSEIFFSLKVEMSALHPNKIKYYHDLTKYYSTFFVVVVQWQEPLKVQPLNIIQKFFDKNLTYKILTLQFSNFLRGHNLKVFSS